MFHPTGGTCGLKLVAYSLLLIGYYLCVFFSYVFVFVCVQFVSIRVSMILNFMEVLYELSCLQRTDGGFGA